MFKKKNSDTPLLDYGSSSTSEDEGKEDELIMDDDTAGSGHIDWWFGCLGSISRERERKWIFRLLDPGLLWAIAHGCAGCRPPRATRCCSSALYCPRRSDQRLSISMPVFFVLFLFKGFT